ncbi:uncharacterized protein MONBRDRAFT_25610 [Monosiga brevicollis MX1]|uniref:WW domain-containing protein n=1 Tax=Monosiga brevicollis TaxID=81824 RepID=A9V0N3_MONBE|nr:uncharacterized protein MONBRDRAFT_25610 [Monosiga brevicollis MX1]EDQ88910.1 predicted protein [Monosiga brevicollis MX1]|eukprot:XP_001746015.1 hypothetical protein [Monosiga brevicollis MX1]
MTHSRPHLAQDGRTYYHNTATNETSWNPPPAPAPAPAPAPQQQTPGTWQEARAPDGRVYYYNTVTQATSWEKPAGYATDPAAATSTPATTTSTGAAAATSNKSADEKPEIPEFATKEEAKEAFTKMLYDLECRSNWPWDKIVRACTSDGRFHVLKKGEKKQVWNAWRGKRAKEEKEELRAQAREAREKLKVFFAQQEATGPELRPNEAVDLFRSFPELNSKVLSDREMESIYDEALRVKMDEEKESFRQRAERTEKKFEELLADTPAITEASTWDEIMDALSADPRFKDEPDFAFCWQHSHVPSSQLLSGLTGGSQEDGILDCLVAYERRLDAYSRKKDEEYKAAIDADRREDRKKREAFVELLDQMIKDEIVTANSVWRITYPEMLKHTAYTDMMGVPGTTPLDFFKIRTNELQQTYRRDKALIKDIFKEKDFVVTVTTTGEEFMELLQNDDRVASVSALHLKMIFESMLERALRNQKREAEANRDTREDAFRDLLSRNLIALKADTEWKDVEFMFKDEPSVQAYEKDPETLLKVFRAFLASDPWRSSEGGEPDAKKVKT